MVGKGMQVRIKTVHSEEILFEFIMSCSPVEHQLYFDESYREIYFLRFDFKAGYATEMREIQGSRYTTAYVTNAGIMYLVVPRMSPVRMSSNYSEDSLLPGIKDEFNERLTTSLSGLIEAYGYVIDSTAIAHLAEIR